MIFLRPQFTTCPYSLLSQSRSPFLVNHCKNTIHNCRTVCSDLFSCQAFHWKILRIFCIDILGREECQYRIFHCFFCPVRDIFCDITEQTSEIENIRTITFFKSWDPIIFALLSTLFQDVPYNSGNHNHLRRHRYCVRSLRSSRHLPLRLRMCSPRMLQVSISTTYSRLSSLLLELSADLRSWDYIMSMSAVLCNRAQGLNFQILTNLNIKANGRERWKSWLRR